MRRLGIGSIIFLQFRFWYIVFLPVHIMLQQQRKIAVLSKANLINQSLNGIRHLARNRHFIGTFFKNASIFCYVKFSNTKLLSSGTFENLQFIITKHQQFKVVNSKASTYDSWLFSILCKFLILALENFNDIANLLNIEVMHNIDHILHQPHSMQIYGNSSFTTRFRSIGVSIQCE